MDTRSIGPLGRRVLNLALWFNFCALTGTGLLMAIRLPPGSRGGAGLAALGLSRHEWGDIHAWSGYAFAALIVVHLVLHWRWLWQYASRKQAWPIVLGIGLGILLVIALIFLPVERKGGHRTHAAPETKSGCWSSPDRGLAGHWRDAANRVMAPHNQEMTAFCQDPAGREARAIYAFLGTAAGNGIPGRCGFLWESGDWRTDPPQHLLGTVRKPMKWAG